MPQKTPSPEMAEAIREAVAAALAQRDAQDAARLAAEAIERDRGKPKPDIVTEEVDGYIHCPNVVVCASNGEQFPVRLTRETVSESYIYRGADNGDPRDSLTENSHTYLRLADDTPLDCPVCGATRELSEQRRPTYLILSGKDPKKLLELKRGEAGVAVAPADRVKALEAELAAAREKAA